MVARVTRSVAIGAQRSQAALDIIDALEGRIRAGFASGETAANPTEKGPGNDRAAEAGREVAVSPALAQAAKRLVSVGCPPLRVEKRYGGLLALHLLQSKDTFTAYAESKGLSGSALREVMTIARALDQSIPCAVCALRSHISPPVYGMASASSTAHSSSNRRRCLPRGPPILILGQL